MVEAADGDPAVFLERTLAVEPWRYVEERDLAAAAKGISWMDHFGGEAAEEEIVRGTRGTQRRELQAGNAAGFGIDAVL